MAKTATLYRMKTAQHICPFGLRSKDLLERKGYAVDDNLLTSREDTDEFKQTHGVETTPQTFINGKRVGGYDDLRAYFDMQPAGQTGTSYTPVIAIFSIALLCILAFQLAFGAQLWSLDSLMLFVALSMLLLALQKLQDLYSFSNSFITYDLLAMKQLRYAYLYPFLEAYSGLGMIAGLPAWSVAPVSLFIGLVGAVSVTKAVYIDKRELKCACVGGDSNVPLGFVSLTENLMMIFVGVMMFLM